MLQRNFKGHLVQPPRWSGSKGKKTFSQIRLLEAPFNLALNFSRDGASTSLGLCYYFSTLSKQESFREPKCFRSVWELKCTDRSRDKVGNPSIQSPSISGEFFHSPFHTSIKPSPIHPLGAAQEVLTGGDGKVPAHHFCYCCKWILWMDIYIWLYDPLLSTKERRLNP